MRIRVVAFLAPVVLLVCASLRATPDSPSLISVSASGVPDGYTVMGRWLDQPLFETAVKSPSLTAPYIFATKAAPGKGQLQVWVLRTPARGGSYRVKEVELQPSTNYTLRLSFSESELLSLELQEK